MTQAERIAQATTLPPLDRALKPSKIPGWAYGLLAVAMLYLFIAAINLMGHGLKVAAKDPVADAYIRDSIFSYAQHPLTGLCIGILVTSLVQSSSFTTSLTVGLVAAGDLSVFHAVPIIMGANIGTSVTNLLVSLGHVRRRREFRRALAGAAVHDFFNWLTVVVLFPLEWGFRLLSRAAEWTGHWIQGSGTIAPNPEGTNLVKTAVSPLIKGCDWLFQDLLHLSAPWAGGITAGLAVVLLFIALFFLVKGLRGFLLDRLSGLFQRVLFVHPASSFAVGILMTVLVQSSSVSTSLAVPLIGAGLLRIRQVYPYTLGANIGTTVTALLAASALAAAADTVDAANKASFGLAVALAHLLFNLIGTGIFWPLQRVPISLAKGFARLASRQRIWVAVFLVGVFFVLPLAVIIGIRLMSAAG